MTISRGLTEECVITTLLSPFHFVHNFMGSKVFNQYSGPVIYSSYHDIALRVILLEEFTILVEEILQADHSIENTVLVFLLALRANRQNDWCKRFSCHAAWCLFTQKMRANVGPNNLNYRLMKNKTVYTL